MLWQKMPRAPLPGLFSVLTVLAVLLGGAGCGVVGGNKTNTGPADANTTTTGQAAGSLL
jgi:hypothetical protein